MSQRLLLMIGLLALLTTGCDRAELESLLGTELPNIPAGDSQDREEGEDADEDREEREEGEDADEDREEREESESEDFESDEDDGDDPIDSSRDGEREEATADGLRIQAIGDSHLAFNGAMSTANQLGQILNDRGVPTVLENNAIGGATLGCGERGIGTGDNCIPPQYQDGQWSHVVISAGGNDFLESQCGIDVNALITPNLDGGLMVDMVSRLRQSVPEVIIVGYVQPLDPEEEAAQCSPLETLMARYRDFASRQTGVRFVDTRTVFGRDQRAMYADDIHTSVEGSRRLASHIADLIVQ